MAANLGALNKFLSVKTFKMETSETIRSPVALRIEAPQRRSTRTVYEAKWSVFVRWCEGSQVDFRSPSIKQVADFQESSTQYHWWLQVSHCGQVR